METVEVLGYPVHVGTVSELVNHLEAGLQLGQHQHVVTLNPEMLMAGEANPAFGKLLKDAQLILPDGAGLVWALRRKHIEVTRLPGIEFSEQLIAYAAHQNATIALIGAQPEVLEATRANLAKRFGVSVVYAHHGFFQDADHRKQVVRECAQTNPKMVFVALGVPGQENWIVEFKGLFTQPTIFVGVGGSFDIWSGLKKRAPALFLNANLEWLWRITSEPFRLKRVYKTLPLFVLQVLLRDK